MDPNTLTTAGLGIAVLASGVYSGWQSLQAKRQASSAKDHASTAADNSKPVSNGFTKEVREGMAEILAMATEARDKATQAVELGEHNRDAHTRHLEAHANGLAPITYPRAVQR